MPRPILVPLVNPSHASYTLSAHDEWTLLAVSCVFNATGHDNPYSYPIFQWTDPAGGIIYRQQLNSLLNDSVFVSASADAEPWYVSNDGPAGFPQSNIEQGNAVMSIRLPAITLYAGCNFSIYSLKSVIDGVEIIPFYLSPYNVIDGAHLWVEDVAASQFEPIVPGPYMLVGGPNA